MRHDKNNKPSKKRIINGVILVAPKTIDEIFQEAGYIEDNTIRFGTINTNRRLQHTMKQLGNFSRIEIHDFIETKLKEGIENQLEEREKLKKEMEDIENFDYFGNRTEIDAALMKERAANMTITEVMTWMDKNVLDKTGHQR